MGRVQSSGHVQRVLAVNGPLTSHGRPRRPLCTALEYRQTMTHRCHIGRGHWHDYGRRRRERGVTLRPLASVIVSGWVNLTTPSTRRIMIVFAVRSGKVAVMGFSKGGQRR